MALLGTITGYSGATREGLPPAIEITTQTVNLDQVMAALEVFGDRAAAELARSLYREGEAIMKASKQECPVDTGTLRDSGDVFPPSTVGTQVSVTLGYGGAGMPYALRQHEEYWHHTVGKRKYLEDPFKAAATDMDERLAKELRTRGGALGGAGG